MIITRYSLGGGGCARAVCVVVAEANAKSRRVGRVEKSKVEKVKKQIGEVKKSKIHFSTCSF